jgi:hypothetical protein
MLRVQAVWNQQYIISAGNMMSGKMYTPNGAIVVPTTIATGDNWQVREVIVPRLIK